MVRAARCACKRGFNETPAERGGRPAVARPTPSSSKLASMRPPQNAGEDKNLRITTRTLAARFNETPAERGGRRAMQATLAARDVASMRPPQNAGEDRPTRNPAMRTTGGFNETPAERGGRPPRGVGRDGEEARFNETPAERGGRLGSELRLPLLTVLASMRPPQNAGEDHALGLGVRAGNVLASMRPPQNAGEDWRPSPSRARGSGGFNETPAERGGRRPKSSSGFMPARGLLQ